MKSKLLNTYSNVGSTEDGIFYCPSYHDDFLKQQMKQATIFRLAAIAIEMERDCQHIGLLKPCFVLVGSKALILGMAVGMISP